MLFDSLLRTVRTLSQDLADFMEEDFEMRDEEVDFMREEEEDFMSEEEDDPSLRPPRSTPQNDKRQDEEDILRGI